MKCKSCKMALSPYAQTIQDMCSSCVSGKLDELQEGADKTKTRIAELEAAIECAVGPFGIPKSVGIQGYLSVLERALKGKSTEEDPLLKLRSEKALYGSDEAEPCDFRRGDIVSIPEKRGLGPKGVVDSVSVRVHVQHRNGQIGHYAPTELSSEAPQKRVTQAKPAHHTYFLPQSSHSESGKACACSSGATPLSRMREKILATPFPVMINEILSKEVDSSNGVSLARAALLELKEEGKIEIDSQGNVNKVPDQCKVCGGQVHNYVCSPTDKPINWNDDDVWGLVVGMRSAATADKAIKDLHDWVKERESLDKPTVQEELLTARVLDPLLHLLQELRLKALQELFTPGEVKAIRAMVRHLAEREGEDVIGAIMKTSGHQYLNDEGVVALAKKLA